MKYIGTVVDNYQRKDRTETLISIEGLTRPQQIAVIWSTNRSADALRDLVLGTRVIFAAHEDTLTQRTDTDETTGATSTILVAVGHFYDVLDDTRDAAEIYETIETKPLTFAGTVVAVEAQGANRSVTLTMPRHGQHQPIQTRWPPSMSSTALARRTPGSTSRRLSRSHRCSVPRAAGEGCERPQKKAAAGLAPLEPLAYWIITRFRGVGLLR